MRSPPRLGAAAAALTLALVCSPVPQATGAQPTLTFRGAGLVGGGFVNVIVADPFDPSVLLAGGDVSGFHRSIDGGRTWTTSNTGVAAILELPVATILFSRRTPGLVYAGVGKRGDIGGLLVSTDAGISWASRSNVPLFSGTDNQGVKGLPSPHPRSTGTLLAEDPESGALYAATFAQGVLRSDDGGFSWTTLGLAGEHLRGLAFDPANPDTLFVGAYNDGVYVTTNASSAGTFTKLAGSPLNPEELLLLGESLYVAAGKAGVFRTRDGGATWQSLGGAAIPTTGPSWMSIAGYRACDRDVVYVGAIRAGSNAIVRTTDDGVSWVSVTSDPSLVHTTIGGPGGTPWWLGGQSRWLPGGGSYAASSIVVGTGPAGGTDCLDPHVRVAGRSGIWGSTNAGGDWYPFMEGLGVSIARDVIGDPAVAGRVYVATADWVFFHSGNSLVTVTQKRPPGVSRGTSLTIDPSTSPGRVYVGSAKPTTNGEVFSSANPPSTGWTDEGLSSVAGGWMPLDVAVLRDGSQRILLAAVERAGIYRKVGSTWTRVNAVAMSQPQISRGASLASSPGSAAVFLFDRESGVWRSSDRGKTWTKIWSLESSVPGTGYLALDPSTPGRLYVSTTGSGVWRIDGATTGSVDGGSLTPTLVGAFPTAGPIEFGPTGDLWLAISAGPGVAAGLYRWDGAAWSLASDPAYAAFAVFPFNLWAAPDGRVFVATNGNGVVVGTPT